MMKGVKKSNPTRRGRKDQARKTIFQKMRKLPSLTRRKREGVSSNTKNCVALLILTRIQMIIFILILTSISKLSILLKVSVLTHRTQLIYQMIELSPSKICTNCLADPRHQDPSLL